MARTKKQKQKPAAAEPTPREVVERPEATLAYLDPAEIIPWPLLNPRRHFDEAKLAELADSIRTHGVRAPIAVHDNGEAVAAAEGVSRWWLIAGERRWRAAQLAGVKVAAAVSTYTLEEAVEVALIENLQREDLSPIEEARGFQMRLDVGDGITQEQLGELIGKSQSYISNRIRLLQLPEEILALIEEGKIEPTHARDVLLPFVGIPEKKRGKLFADVAKVARAVSAAPLPESQLLATVRSAAKQASHSLKPLAWSAPESPLFDVARHDKECDCGAPKFQYEPWESTPTRRCFNSSWWNAAQKEAKEKAAAREKAAQERARAKAEKIGDVPVLAQKQAGRAQEILCGIEDPGTGDEVDPALLPPESLAFVATRPDRAPALVCTDQKAYDAALKKTREEVRALADQYRREATQRHLEEVKALKLDADLLRDLLLSLFNSDGWELAEELRKLAVQLDYLDAVEGRDDDDPADRVAGLSAPQVATLAKLYVLQERERGVRRDPYAYARRDPYEDRARRDVAARYAAAARALFPRDGLSDADVAEFAALTARLADAIDADGYAVRRGKRAGEETDHPAALPDALAALKAFVAEHPDIKLGAAADCIEEAEEMIEERAEDEEQDGDATEGDEDLEDEEEAA